MEKVLIFLDEYDTPMQEAYSWILVNLLIYEKPFQCDVQKQIHIWTAL